jgi:DNA-binding beta-propeller fold protein YncE
MVGDIVVLLCVGVATVQAAEAPPSLVRSWGSVGSAPGQFYGPTAIGGDAAGNIYVSDGLNNRIQKFDANGNFLLQWGTRGSGPGQLWFPWGIDCDATGNVYVSDLWNNRVQKFSSNGQYLARWGSLGSGPGQFDNAPFLAVDDSDRVYVADGTNRRIQKFDADGHLLDIWSTPEFSTAGIAVSGGRVIAVNGGQPELREYDLHGNVLGTFGSGGYGYGELFRPWDVELDEAGSLYVTSVNESRITKFSAGHELLTQWGAPVEFGDEQAVYVHPNHLVYVVDRIHGRVLVYEVGAVAARSTSWGAIKAGYR